ncbi:unnamed protein product [Heligmosomoides polygyrus]|uniref:C2H2-type domain-containing protein n=1 Tax=Heligmosomoides polygyrus TaxID=6339 RepID=A0A183GNA7_HELPZ|nr:unnamed protein product [Heligmosomoides polygyrus]
MHYKADESALSECRMYKDWCVSSGNVPNNGSEDQATTFIREINPEDWSKERGNKYRCGKCRHVLFFGEHVMKHKRLDGEICEFGYLIEPMKWMNVSDYEGKGLAHRGEGDPNGERMAELVSQSWNASDGCKTCKYR